MKELFVNYASNLITPPRDGTVVFIYGKNFDMKASKRSLMTLKDLVAALPFRCQLDSKDLSCLGGENTAVRKARMFFWAPDGTDENFDRACRSPLRGRLQLDFGSGVHANCKKVGLLNLSTHLPEDAFKWMEQFERTILERYPTCPLSRNEKALAWVRLKGDDTRYHPMGFNKCRHNLIYQKLKFC